MHSATLSTFTVATNEYRGGGNAERTEYHPCLAWDRLAEITGQFLSKGQLVDIEGRLQTRQWDDDAGKRHWKTAVDCFYHHRLMFARPIGRKMASGWEKTGLSWEPAVRPRYSRGDSR